MENNYFIEALKKNNYFFLYIIKKAEVVCYQSQHYLLTITIISIALSVMISYDNEFEELEQVSDA